MLRKLLTNGHIRCARRFSSSKAIPELTKDRYNVKRGEYSLLTDGHMAFFMNLLGQNRVINDPSECESYNIDWIKNVRGQSRCILKPRTTEEVSKILEFCNENKLAVCPQGGNTGLVGGSVPVFDEIVISTALMNQIESIDEISGVIVCQAGCILENIDQQIGEKGLMVPLDLGAKGSCHIGGNVSTNAGGLRLLRYGNLHGSVLGVEAVKANGEILDCLSTLKKDNTGYHLKHLFIGSEGSLGVVTKVAIQCPTKPKAINMAFLGVESFDSVLTTFRRCKNELGEILSSFELIDALSLDVVTGHYKMQSPIPQFPFYILIETHGSCNEHDEEKLNRFLESAMGDGVVLDGTATNQPSKMKQLWELRESITQGLLMDGYVFKYDLSIPIKEFYAIVDVMNEKIGKDAVRICGYGHIGDSNIHLNLSFKEYSKEMHNKIEPFVYEYTSSLKGSVSAEHGIGFRKSKYVHYSKSPAAINLMQDIKRMMDPNKILNPYKVLPESS
ncbi:PREDICTED: D-2-hydroxyglutarate dehydrogenase, mitochondrial-like [Nicrophorus vespilloides]|uniref:D-2-hydroxyglutarate dehydrogenase, mitochondrial n=1 Tax=Nicrophorus vespilloides TaxID=110193 RepID=A0ABM1MIF1_NICVS|nr:PREDICTED: D-2-hydroxyglutarate dehydrogenase, mitochondrial-like [Nicrophorus vespilloides]XP_017774348.1 PREDICTED: D-2-hydroxyglutarate dehydrogenase, mitochondrial-like [Nicrophorus vespilloides]XP_017774349.1 PREDICTED: D-2-hydroxyglutarate dehydrogenase, mitochondrial-like [Nicrophorus vespilloides]XP_017774350.1 PREDICTED: D-2-hydroxyglutarate dehydrogenase, mitochondrial-like [Nicrophorus vespilloides]XP_017774351.1 PREDICTED: D-2-hydroxyglutarate dehydrogenase, mitochondrial-like [N